MDRRTRRKKTSINIRSVSTSSSRVGDLNQRQNSVIRSGQFDDSDHPLFRRYWETEKNVRQWMQAYRQSTASYSNYGPMGFLRPSPILTAPIQSEDREISESADILHETSNEITIDAYEDNDPAAIIDESEMKMELSDDIMAFMAHSMRHRIEREKRKALEQEIQDRTVIFVPADRPFAPSTFNEFGGDAAAVEEMLANRQTGGISTLSELRRQKTIQLYGTEAAGRIQAEETFMQMKFDEEYGKYHPPFWPNIPLKL